MHHAAKKYKLLAIMILIFTTRNRLNTEIYNAFKKAMVIKCFRLGME